MAETGPFSALFDLLKSGELSRRDFIARAGALGMGAAAATMLANVAGASAKSPGSLKNGWAFTAQEATPAAVAPTSGTEGQQRGAGGELKLIQWQAPTLLSPHVATGVKDSLASAPIFDPLMHYLPDGTLIPCLITEVPTVENGLLKEDLTEATLKLLPGLLWSDGQPVTSADIVFTWQWVMAPENGSTNSGNYETIADIVAVDELTAKVTYKNGSLNWFAPHTGTSAGYLYPKHVLESGVDAGVAFRQNPIGTGPYKVDSFHENDQVIYSINENYREPNKPYFSSVNLKGGGDAVSAARAVLQTGDYDFAWNLQVEPAILNDIAAGGKGQLITFPGGAVERINFQFADPNTEVNGQRAEKSTVHPIWGDKAVREAFSYAVDRQTIGEQLYLNDENEFPTANYVSGIARIQSPNTSFTFDVEKAKQTLEAAGWTGDGTRKKGDVELKIKYATSVNAVRQKEQAIAKQGLEQAGFEVELQQVDAGIYFDSSEGNEQNINHFYWDIDMYQSVSTSPWPMTYLFTFYAGPDGENIAQKENSWAKSNFQRYANPEFDAVYEQLQTTTDAEQAAQLFIQANDILVNDFGMIGLVSVGGKAAYSNRLNADNLALGPFEYHYWNIANWNESQG